MSGIRLKAILKQDNLAKKHPCWAKRLMSVDNGYMVEVYWTGIEYKPPWNFFYDNETNAFRTYNFIKNIKILEQTQL